MPPYCLRGVAWLVGRHRTRSLGLPAEARREAGAASSQLLICCSLDAEPYQFPPGTAAVSASPGIQKLHGNLVCQADVSCLDRRNQNYMNILRFLTLGDKKLSPFNITHRFTHLFWLGDLNYRVEQPPTVRDSVWIPGETKCGVAIEARSPSNLGQHGRKRGSRRDPQGTSVTPAEGNQGNPLCPLQGLMDPGLSSGTLCCCRQHRFPRPSPCRSVSRHLSLSSWMQRLPFCSAWLACTGSQQACRNRQAVTNTG